jgi:hypothetical protein
MFKGQLHATEKRHFVVDVIASWLRTSGKAPEVKPQKHPWITPQRQEQLSCRDEAESTADVIKRG